jgi:hypothetical protein
MIDFAYARLGLKFNPFGELDRQQRIDCLVPRCDSESLVAFLSHPTARRAVQFTGPPGSGKSTHLLWLALQLADFHYIHLPVDGSRAVPVSSCLMVDEAQRLTWWQRRRLFRNARKVILGTHRCFARPLRRQGFAVRVVSLHQPPPVAWLIEAWQRRIQAAQRRVVQPCSSAETVLPWVSPDVAARLREEFGPNIRAMEGCLYESVQSRDAASRDMPPAELR